MSRAGALVTPAELAAVDAAAAEHLRALRRPVFIPQRGDVAGSALAGLVGLAAARRLANRFGGRTCEAAGVPA